MPPNWPANFAGPFHLGARQGPPSFIRRERGACRQTLASLLTFYADPATAHHAGCAPTRGAMSSRHPDS
eukprot:4150598-Pyramimonas_sp.AAC.1